MKIKCPHCGSESFKVHQRNGHECNTIYRCQDCLRCFSGRRFTPYADTKLKPEKIVSVIQHLCEGNSVRSTERLLRVHRGTVLSMLALAGEHAQSVTDEYVRKLRPKYVQFDELWTFVHTKEAHLRRRDPAEWGDAYTWVALDSQTKLIISHLVGKRDAASANEFIADYASRIGGIHQATSDGFKPYIDAIETYFGADINFAQLVKVYGSPKEAAPDWYGPAEVINAIPTPIIGEPDEAHISTSHVERSNLNFRMHLRRFTRLVNAFSKKLDNLKAAVALYVAWYNFCRVHRTLRVTPAMEAGLTDHVWSVEELLNVGANASNKQAA